jgi:ACDE family multidrug resistance protein
MKKDSLLKLVALSGVQLIMVLGNSMLIPVFPDMQRALEISKLQAGLTITLFSLPAGIVIPIMGFLCDKIGRKKIIVPSLILYASGGLISGLAVTFFAKSFPILLLGRVVQGIGAAGTGPIAMALVSDIFTSNERSKALGSLEAANGLGKVLSPILGSVIALIVWYAIFFVYAIFALPVAIAVWLLIKEPPIKTKSESISKYINRICKVFKESGLGLFGCYLAGSVVLLVLFGLLSYLSDVLEEKYNLHGIIKGVVLAAPVLAMSTTSFLSGKYLQKNQKKMKTFIVSGLFIVSLSLAAVSLINSNVAFFAGTFIMGIGTGLVLPAVNTLVTSSCSLEERGGITALYGSVRFFGVAAGPPLFSWLLEQSKNVMFYSGAGLTLLSGVIAVFVINEKKLMSDSKKKEKTQEPTAEDLAKLVNAGILKKGEQNLMAEYVVQLRWFLKRKNK